MARVVATYRDQIVDMVREGKRGRWRYTVRTGRTPRATPGHPPVAVGAGFETSDAAFHHAVRHINQRAADAGR
jgi:hypothetical protein